MNPHLTRFVLVVAGLFFIHEVLGDIIQGESFSHYVFEGAIFVLIFTTLLMEYLKARRIHKELRDNRDELASLKENLAGKVQQQFSEWSLSPSEGEVAWLIIKGFSFSEIASLRSVAEKTVRQQASSIYKKSSTSNRAEFSAEFLSDMLDHQQENK